MRSFASAIAFVVLEVIRHVENGLVKSTYSKYVGVEVLNSVTCTVWNNV